MEIFKIKSESELKRLSDIESYNFIQKLDLFGKIIHGYAIHNTIYFEYINKTYCISEYFANRLCSKIHKIKIL